MRKILAYITVPCSDVYIKVEEGFRPFGSAFFDHEMMYAVQPMIQYEHELTIKETLDLVNRNRVSLTDEIEKPDTVDWVQTEKPNHVDLENGTRVHLLADGPGPHLGDVFVANLYEARSSPVAHTDEPVRQVLKNGQPLLGTYPTSTQATRAALDLQAAYDEGVGHGRAYQGALGDVS